MFIPLMTNNYWLATSEFQIWNSSIQTKKLSNYKIFAKRALINDDSFIGLGVSFKWYAHKGT